MSAAENGEHSLNFKITGRSLLKYACPTILSNLFMNIYGLVDSLFISNVIGTDALSALNIVSPLMMVASALGIMISTGGGALTAKLMGEGKDREAKETFSLLTVFITAVTTGLCILGLLFRRPLLYAMGADDALYPLCEAYIVPILIGLPFCTAGMVCSMFFVTAGKPTLGFSIAVAGGVLNMVLDYVLIAVVQMGMLGAALATSSGYILQTIIGVAYFSLKRDGLLYFVRPKWRPRAVLKSCSNGMSEMVSVMASSVVTIVMNIVLMRLAGSDGVAAMTVVLYLLTILSSVYMGYNSGCAPIISFHYGDGDTASLRAIFRVMLKTLAVLSVAACLLSLLLARPVALIYASGEDAVIEMAVTGIRFFTPAFLLMGFNMYASSLFTALNDGRTSALLSFCRLFMFQLVPLLLLPQLLGLTGVWLSLPLSEVLGFVMTLCFLRRGKSIYHYA